MASVFELLDEVQQRPELFLGWNGDRGAQLRDLETLLMGYSHAIARHRIDDPGGQLLASFGNYLHERHGWSQAQGPIAAIRANAANDDEAWKSLWVELAGYRAHRRG